MYCNLNDNCIILLIEMISTFWRRISKSKQFIEGGRISPSAYNKLQFKNNLNNLTRMFELRSWFVEHSPYGYHNAKYTNDMAILHKELNHITAHITMRRVIIVAGGILIYMSYFMEEEARDWKDKFDIKYNTKAYGNLDDSSGEGNTGIDD